MSTHKHSAVNPLINPVQMGDSILAESGAVFIVRQNMRGEYWLEHAEGKSKTQPVFGQVAICCQISDLVDA